MERQKEIQSNVIWEEEIRWDLGSFTGVLAYFLRDIVIE
jgi:hypothetical protein